MADDDVYLDPALYSRSPILDVPAAIALAVALITVFKKHAEVLPAPVRAAVKGLRTAAVDLESAWDGQRNAGLVTAEDSRPADQLSDRSFAAVSRRLEGLMLLPETFEESRRATRMYQRLFPAGLAFLKLDYPRQWAECQQRVRDIETNGLTDELTELCGEAVVGNLIAAHANYGRALGITKVKEETPKPPKVAAELRALQEAIVDYAVQLVAAGRAQRKIAASVAACLRPIDKVREDEASRGTASASSTSPAPSTPTPTPAVTPATPIPALDGLE